MEAKEECEVNLNHHPSAEANVPSSSLPEVRWQETFPKP